MLSLLTSCAGFWCIVCAAVPFHCHHTVAFVFRPQIVSCVVEPLVQMTSVSASRLPTIDMATYMVNSVHVIHSALALYEFTDQRLEMLQAQVREKASK